MAHPAPSFTAPHRATLLLRHRPTVGRARGSAFAAALRPRRLRSSLLVFVWAPASLMLRPARLPLLR
eukprot:7953321-Alexandrium_andersonii.AAC.1